MLYVITFNIDIRCVIDKRTSILYTLGRGELMFKKTILLFIVLFAFLLTGCDIEKTVTLPNSQPDELFMLTVDTLKKELPSAKIKIDVPNKKISFTDNTLETYPSNLDFLFMKNNNNTDIKFSAKDTDENKLKNLQTLLVNSYELYKQTKANAIEEEEPIKQQLRINTNK